VEEVTVLRFYVDIFYRWHLINFLFLNSKFQPLAVLSYFFPDENGNLALIWNFELF